MQPAGYPDVPPEFGHWLAGFIDGEAAFMIVRANRRGFLPRFELCQRDDDGGLLDSIVRTTGIGRVIWRDRYENEAKVKSKPRLSWRVDNRAHLAPFVCLLERYPLRSRKARDFEVWAQAVRLFLAFPPGGRGAHGHDWGAIAELRDELKRVRAYPSSPPRTIIRDDAMHLFVED